MSTCMLTFLVHTIYMANITHYYFMKNQVKYFVMIVYILCQLKLILTSFPIINVMLVGIGPVMMLLIGS